MCPRRSARASAFEQNFIAQFSRQAQARIDSARFPNLITGAPAVKLGALLKVKLDLSVSINTKEKIEADLPGAQFYVWARDESASAPGSAEADF